MRSFDREHCGAYYRTLIDFAPHVRVKKLAGWASMVLAHAAVHSRDTDGVPIVAIDIAGPESGFPADDHM